MVSKNSKTKKENTSIQISSPIHDALKIFCEESGFKMNRFAEKAILTALSGSYKLNIYETK